MREGVALYFADASSLDESSSKRAGGRERVSCPKDEEFVRPVSAGAHRAAYARAEACVRRAIADGKRWQDVR